MEMGLLLANVGLMIIILLGAGVTLIGLPGNLLIFLSALGYGYWEHFTHLNSTFLLLLFGIFVLGEVVEFLAGALGAKREHGSGQAVAAAIFGAVLGGIAGTGLLPLVGTILGAMLGAFIASFLAEFAHSGDVEKSRRVAVSVAIGQITGMLFKLVVALGMAAAVALKLPWL
jgi:hypothetical protein